VAATIVFSTPDDGRRKRPKHVECTCQLWHSVADNWPWASLLDIHHPNQWHAPAAATTVFRTPDDGHRERPKHVECTCQLWHSVADNQPWTSLLDIHHPDQWHTPVAATIVFSTLDDGHRKHPKHVECNCRLWHSVVDNRPWMSLLDIHHSDQWHAPVAATTVFSTPDDGRRKHPKHAECTCSG